MDAVTNVPVPLNEKVNDYAVASPERARLETKLSELAGRPTDIRQVIGGVHRRADGTVQDVVQPHRHASVIGSYTNATHTDVRDAIEAAAQAAPHGATCRSTSGRRSSCAPPICCPDRGARRSPPRRCSASPRPRTRPRSTRRAS